MDDYERITHRVDLRQDDVLDTLPIVASDPVLLDRLFDQLVDLLVVSMFIGMREEYRAGLVDRDAYLAQARELAERCRGHGLLPVPT